MPANRPTERIHRRDAALSENAKDGGAAVDRGGLSRRLVIAAPLAGAGWLLDSSESVAAGPLPLAREVRVPRSSTSQSIWTGWAYHNGGVADGCNGPGTRYRMNVSFLAVSKSWARINRVTLQVKSPVKGFLSAVSVENRVIQNSMGTVGHRGQPWPSPDFPGGWVSRNFETYPSTRTFYFDSQGKITMRANVGIYLTRTVRDKYLINCLPERQVNFFFRRG